MLKKLFLALALVFAGVALGPEAARAAAFGPGLAGVEQAAPAVTENAQYYRYRYRPRRYFVRRYYRPRFVVRRYYRPRYVVRRYYRPRYYRRFY